MTLRQKAITQDLIKEEIMKKAVLRAGDNILDVACGNGYLLGELSKKRKSMRLA